MFWFSKNIPANTTKQNPVTVTWDLDYGFINKLIIVIPSGVSGLAGVRLLRTGSQFMPRNLGEYIFGDNLKLEIPLAIKMYDRPFTITGIFYNEDDTYDHKIIVCFGFIKGKPSKAVQNFNELLRYKL